MEKPSALPATILGLCIGLGLVVAGFALGHGVYASRIADRVVSVRGLAEREVDADLAIWPVTFKEAGNDLAQLQRSIDTKRETIARFLESAGFKRAEVSYSASKINDTQAEAYGGAQMQPKFRYVAQATVTLRSTNVAAVKKTIEQSGQLVAGGIALAENWENRTQYLFTGLNSIKPEMIEAATKSARESAEKFATDSGSKVGKIKSASQGLFEISDLDANSPDRKQVRVVTRVDYFLVDE
ncbi:MAG: SIMPL domain-containing protein [Bacteroidota bacterium]